MTYFCECGEDCFTSSFTKFEIVTMFEKREVVLLWPITILVQVAIFVMVGN